MKYLIVNADDYNLTEGVSRGIADSFLKGIVTATTFMANLPILPENIKLLSDLELKAGIHFNLTYGKPLCSKEDVTDLTDERGYFFRHFAGSSCKNIDNQIFMELTAQYNRFLDCGLIPSHFDSHHHIHSRPELRKIFFAFAREKKMPMRSLNGEHRIEVKQENIVTPEYFYDGFYGEEATLSNLLGILHSLPEGVSELMCHPGYTDTALGNISSYSENREKELKILTHPEIMDFIAEKNIKLINYFDLSKIYGK